VNFHQRNIFSSLLRFTRVHRWCRYDFGEACRQYQMEPNLIRVLEDDVPVESRTWASVSNLRRVTSENQTWKWRSWWNSIEHPSKISKNWGFRWFQQQHIGIWQHFTNKNPIVFPGKSHNLPAPSCSRFLCALPGTQNQLTR
jgi:hypothetical protein